MKPRVPVLVLLFVASAALQLRADYRPIRGSVLVLAKSASSEEDPEFRSLLLSVCRVEIEARELELLEPRTAPPEGEEPARTALKAGAEFALLASYATSEREASFELTWYEASTRAKSATVARTAALDFTLDVTIAEAIVEVLDGQADRISALPLKPDPNAVLVVITPSIEAASPPVDQVEPGDDIVRLEPLKRIAFSIGATPLISTFQTANHVTKAYLGLKATAAWRFAMLGGAGGIGLVSGWQRYYIRNVTPEGWFSTIPIGAQVQYGTRMPGPFDFVLHLGGGAIAWLLAPDVGSPSRGVVPYVQGGVGFIVNILENLGIALDVDYSLYFTGTGTFPNVTFLEPALMLVLKF